MAQPPGQTAPVPRIGGGIADRLGDIGDIVKLIEEWENKGAQLQRGNAMKLFLTMALPAFLLSTSLMADPSAEAPGPRSGTVEAMQCLTRQGPAKCERMFRGQAQFSAKDWVFPDLDRDFKRGTLVSGTYRRQATNSNGCDVMTITRLPTKEMDIFDVKFAHVRYTFYISPADADGKIRALALSPAPHVWQLCDR